MTCVLPPLLCRDRRWRRTFNGQGRPTPSRVIKGQIGARDFVLVCRRLTLKPGEALERALVYKPLDRFPAVTRDVAFLADRELKYQAVLDAFFASASEPLLVDIRLFDLFVDPKGEKVPLDKKSIACSLTYRASDRTLTQEEANVAHSRCLKIAACRIVLV